MVIVLINHTLIFLLVLPAYSVHKLNQFWELFRTVWWNGLYTGFVFPEKAQNVGKILECSQEELGYIIWLTQINVAQAF